MSLTDLATGALSSVLGIAQPAYLMVNDYRGKITAPSATDSSTSTSASVTDVASDAVGDAALAAEEVLAKSSRAYFGMPDPPTVATGATAKFFLVQYNPSELQVNSILSSDPGGGGADPRGSIQPAENGGNQVVKASSPGNSKSVLSVKLMFDDMLKGDCFVSGVGMLDSAIGFAEDVYTAATGSTSMVHSVQPQVNALLSAIRNPSTRSISFCWSDFVFTGMLTNVSVQYTMFSSSGRPVRAEVSLRIEQEQDPGGSMDNWHKDLEGAFGSSATSLIGSVLNVNL